MHPPIFGRVGRPDNDLRIQQLRFLHHHAGFDAVLFGFNGGGNDTAARRVVGRNDNRLAPQQGVCLLFDGCKAGIQVDVHDSRRVVIEG